MTLNASEPTSEAFVREVLHNGRTASEVIIKAVNVRTATMIAYGHLNSLRQQPPKVQLGKLMIFMIIPTYPIAEFLVAVCRALLRPWRQSTGADWRYHTAYATGSWASGSANGLQNVPVSELDPLTSTLERTTGSRAAQWLARLAVLGCFLVQDFAVILNHYRRPFASDLLPELVNADLYRSTPFAHGSIVTNNFENLNIGFALGGFVAGVISLILVASGWSWSHAQLGPPAQSVGQNPRFSLSRTILDFRDPVCVIPLEIKLAVFLLLVTSPYTTYQGSPHLFFYDVQAALQAPIRPDDIARLRRSDPSTIITSIFLLCAFPTWFGIEVVLPTVFNRSRPRLWHRTAFAMMDYLWSMLLFWWFYTFLFIALDQFTVAKDLVDCSSSVRAELLAKDTIDLNQVPKCCNPWLLWKDPNEGKLWSL